jgi:hypothetical protein
VRGQAEFGWDDNAPKGAKRIGQRVESGTPS